MIGSSDDRISAFPMNHVEEPTPLPGPQRAVLAATADRALRTSELNYRRLFETAQDGILILDADNGRVNDVNPFLIQLLGFSHEEMVGRTVGELSPFKDIVSNQAMLERLQRDGFVRYSDLPLEAKDGHKVAVEFVSNVYQVGEAKVIQCNIREITERKRAEESLRLLGSAVQQSQESIVITDAELDLPGPNIIFVNPAFTRMTGYTPEDVIGKTPRILQGPRTDKAVLQRLQQSIWRGETFAGEAINYRKDGTEFCLEWQIAPIRNAKGRVTHFVATQHDITERKRGEAELRWKTALLEAQVHSSLDGILVVDNQGKKILQNQRLSDLWKIPPKVADNSNDAVQVEYISQQTKHPGQFAEKIAYLYSHPDEISRDEVAMIDGTILDRYSAPVRDPAGKHYGRIWSFRDITETKRVQEAHDRLAMAVEGAAETVVITDTAGTIVYANPAFEKTSGYTPTEALGQNPRVLKSGKQDHEFYAQMWATLRRGEVWSGHFINKRKDGILYEEDATISPLRDAAGTIVNFVAVKRDVTREMQLEEQYRQTQKMEAIGQLAGGVAHDFNNILGIIQMHADLLKLYGGLSSDQSESIDEIATSVQRAATLTRQLLLFSRREVFQPRDLDLNETMAATSKMLKRMLGETIGMEIKLVAQPLLVHADAGMLDQGLMKLCVYALDAMPGGGRLVIETSGVEFDEMALQQSIQARLGSFVCLTVTDNGSGIAPGVLPRIFDPFFTTKPVGKGTGLGLATVFGIVQQHQGWINVYSEGGHGTTFRIYLPRLSGNALNKSAPPPLTALRGGQETILLVEDDPALRFAVRKALDQVGYHILEAPNGVKALAVWKEHQDKISLLLTDLVMPDGMTGKDLAQRLQQENPKLKVIYMSGYSADVVGKTFPLEQDVNFLTKPFPARQLVQAVRECLDAPAAGG